MSRALRVNNVKGLHQKVAHLAHDGASVLNGQGRGGRVRGVAGTPPALHRRATATATASAHTAPVEVVDGSGPPGVGDAPDAETTDARAREDYAHARRALLAAEVTYARAYRALQAAHASSSAVAPVPRPERHYACGHAGMVATERDATQCLSLCPTCAARIVRDARDAFLFAPRRTLLLPTEPAPDQRRGYSGGEALK